MGDMNSARELVSNAALWPDVRDFLWDFAPLIHPSHLSGAKAIDVGASPRLKAHVLKGIGVEPCFHDFPADDGSRLLLLDATTFDSLAKWLGALECADSLRKIMKGEDVKALKAALPGIYPEVFSYGAYFAKFGLKSAFSSGGAKEAIDSVVKSGYASLYCLLEPLPKPLLSRLTLRLPASAPGFGCGEAPKLPRETLLKAALLVLKLKFQEAYQLCSS